MAKGLDRLREIDLESLKAVVESLTPVKLTEKEMDDLEERAIRAIRRDRQWKAIGKLGLIAIEGAVKAGAKGVR